MLIRDYTSKTKWTHLGNSLMFILSNPQIIGWSFALMVISIFFTWLGFSFCVDILDKLTGSFFADPPSSDGVTGWLLYNGWLVVKWLFVFFTRIIAFYLSFLMAYALASPGYSILSSKTEKIKLGKDFVEEKTNIKSIINDLLEGLKIGFFGLIVTVISLLLNFIPAVGQIAVIILYTFYNALMFLDYPASRRGWSLGKKINWIMTNKIVSLRIGIIPSAIGMIPILNIFILAPLLPLITVHATLNFLNYEVTIQKHFTCER